MAFVRCSPLILLPWLLTTACASGGAGARLTYSDQAQAAYAEALDDYFDEDCLMAEPAFEEVRRQYPYSRFAALAELRAADCMFKQEKFAEAIQSYQQFVRYRPSHEEVPYARFQIAAAHYEQMPSDWLLSPPDYERDQHYTHEALRLLRRFILDHPHHSLVPRAQDMALSAVEMLAKHELYVARFYLDREAPKAAVGRLRTLLRSYGGSGQEAEALLLLGSTYEILHEDTLAKTAYRELLERFPNSQEAEDAQKQLKQLKS